MALSGWGVKIMVARSATSGLWDTVSFPVLNGKKSPPHNEVLKQSSVQMTMTLSPNLEKEPNIWNLFLLCCRKTTYDDHVNLHAMKISFHYRVYVMLDVPFMHVNSINLVKLLTMVTGIVLPSPTHMCNRCACISHPKTKHVRL